MAGRRREGERGASVVEFALIAPFLFLVVMGIVEFGLALSNNIGLRQGVREGARQASVANFGTDSTCTVTGVTPSDDTKKLICLTKNRIGLDEGETRLKIALVGAYERGSSILVCAQHDLDSLTGMFEPILSGKYLTNKVEMRIEETAASFTPAAESPPSGGDWSWCV